MTDRALSRRDLFTLRGLGAALRSATPPPASAAGRGERPAVAAPIVSFTSPAARGAPARPLPVLRPPGAVDEATFLARCRPGCDACAVACPPKAIRPAPARLRQAAGTPVIDPREAACAACADAPCITACPTKALDPAASRVMGQALLQRHDCLAWRGTTCTACVERCPVPGALRLEVGKPVVDPARCTGCGTCLQVCPAPSPAFIILPALRRGA